jgi:hypothetical protein
VFNLLVKTVGTSKVNLHSMRAGLINALKPDQVARQQPVLLRYSGATRTVQIGAVYDAGLEWGKPAGVSEDINMRFIAPDPLWYEDANGSGVPGFSTAAANANYLIAQNKTTGVWSALSTGPDSTVSALAYSNNRLYVGGAFANLGAVAAAKIGYWDFNTSTWNAMGTGAAGGNVSSLFVMPNGDIIAGGTFTSMGGVGSTSEIARWNGSAWTAYGNATGGDVRTLAYFNGRLYAGGTFTNIGGSAINYLASSADGTTWTQPGSGLGYTMAVGGLAVGMDGKLYAGTSNKTIRTWDGTNWATAYTSASAYTTSCYQLTFTPDGQLFFLENSVNGPILYYTVYKLLAGGTVSTIAAETDPGGVGNSIRAVYANAQGWVYIGYIGPLTVGSVTYVDGSAYLLYYKGSYFQSELNLAGGFMGAYGFLETDRRLIVAENAHNGSQVSTATSTLTNSGTAAAAPIIRMVGPGTVSIIRNYTTGAAIYFNNLTLATGEVATLNLTPGAISFTSSLRGNILNTILPGSNLTTFKILPGANQISAFVGGTTSAATLIALWWRIAHWSVDGAA